MKKFSAGFIVIVFGFVFTGISVAQPLEGKRFEFSTSASMWNVKSGDGETETVFNLPIRLGVFIFKGLEFEPELFLTIPEESDETGYVILANLSYNFKTSENLMLFVLGGAGYGNGSRLFDFVLDNDMGVTVYNFGAGIKYLVGNSAALRIEYRFTKYSGEKTESYSWVTWTDKLDRTDNNVLLGVSIFF
jgi:hypothetical protein